ncbi:MAG TPA: DDE-type integrase/transposase/recombinase [Polyangiaceae bacterium]|jgi:IS1 family transposase
MANVLPRSKQLAIVGALVEGCSIRSTERMLGVHRDTIMRLGAQVGEGCAELLDETMRDLPCERLELDELWAFIGKKQRRVRATDDAARVGDVWTWVAIDATTKLVPSFMTGKRDANTANAFIKDLAARLRNRVQVTTDGLHTYVAPIAAAFGTSGVDYAQLHKTYEAEPVGPGRYSPPKVTGTEKTPVFGFPIEELVSTSYVERQNLTMRMGIRRFTRLTNAHSKKLENHGAAVALHFAHYNFVRVHQTLRCTPAMAAGVAKTVWSMDDLMSAALDGVRP